MSSVTIVLRQDADTLDRYRRELLFDRDDYQDDLNPKAEHHVLQALAFLELAKVSLKLAILEMEA